MLFPGVFQPPFLVRAARRDLLFADEGDEPGVLDWKTQRLSVLSVAGFLREQRYAAITNGLVLKQLNSEN